MRTPRSAAAWAAASGSGSWLFSPSVSRIMTAGVYVPAGKGVGVATVGEGAGVRLLSSCEASSASVAIVLSEARMPCPSDVGADFSFKADVFRNDAAHLAHLAANRSRHLPGCSSSAVKTCKKAICTVYWYCALHCTLLYSLAKYLGQRGCRQV